MNKLLIIVDMVNGFVREGNMADKYIEHIIPTQLELIKQFKDKKQGVAFIKDNHKAGCSEFLKFPEHCIIGTSEAELVDEFLPYENDSLVYCKNSTSAMFANNFIKDINDMKDLKEIVITGCCTDICILNLAIPLINYLDELNRYVEVIVVKNAVETYDAPWHNREELNNMAYTLMQQAGIKLVDKYEGD